MCSLNSTPRRTGRLTADRNVTWTWTWKLRDCTADYRPVLSSEWTPYMKRKKVIVTQRNGRSSHLLQMGSDTKMNWPTDRRPQYNLNLNLNLNIFCVDIQGGFLDGPLVTLYSARFFLFYSLHSYMQPSWVIRSHCVRGRKKPVAQKFGFVCSYFIRT
jgi:hypothetical protein